MEGQPGKRGEIPFMRTESTLYRGCRQKADVFSPRGPRNISLAHVRALPRLPGRPLTGTVKIGSQSLRCAIGRKGVGAKSREGDSLTPIGRFRILAWMRRPDRWPIFRADCIPISRADGWCDDPRCGSYNRRVRLPFRFGTETLWRDDDLYDLVGIVDYNLCPRIVGRGSAIFLHVAQDGYQPTAGCVALAAEDLRKVQFRLGPRAQLAIGQIFVRRSP